MLFVLASVILSACAQLFMKASMIELQAVDVWHLAAAYPAELPAWLPVIAWGVAGLGCYALSLIFWVVALAEYELSLAYPMLGLSYVLVYAAAVFWPRFGESVSLSRTMGVLLIMVGIALIQRRRRPTARLATKGD